MTSMQHFIINSSICLFSLWLVYKPLLENTSWHQFKRFYLLGTLVISIVIPFIVVKTVVVPLPSFQSLPVQNFEQVAQVSNDAVPAIDTFSIDWNLVLLAFYGTGFMVMLFRFMKNITGLRLKSTDQTEVYQGYRLVLRSKVVVPHSFWNTIYVNAADYRNGKIPREVLDHEKAHLDQRHSIDILLIELLLVAAWFNPLIYILKYSMKLNHEFLADQAVISQGADTKSYQETILKYAATSQNRALANTFNFPIIKKRFTIMKTNTTTASGLLRSLAILPVLALLIVNCGTAQKIQSKISSKIDNTKNIVIEKEIPAGYIMVDSIAYYYENYNNKLTFTDEIGNDIDFEKLGYSIKYKNVNNDDKRLVQDHEELGLIVEVTDQEKLWDDEWLKNQYSDGYTFGQVPGRDLIDIIKITYKADPSTLIIANKQEISLEDAISLAKSSPGLAPILKFENNQRVLKFIKY